METLIFEKRRQAKIYIYFRLFQISLMCNYILFHFYGYIPYFTFHILKYFWIFVSRNGGENEMKCLNGEDIFLIRRDYSGIYTQYSFEK